MGDLVEFITVKSVVVILTADKLAAPTKVILPLPTVTIIFLSISVVEYEPPAISKIELSLKPVITSLPSPSAYLKRTSEPEL